jgi:acyl-CoA dehydrogenase
VDFALSPTEVALTEAARRFARERLAPLAASADEAETAPAELFDEAQALGLLSANLPREFGGPGLTHLEHTLVFEELAWACTGLASALMTNALAVTPLLLAGTAEQQARWFGQRGGEVKLGALCASEPDAGSDVASLRCRFSACRGGFVLNGEKAWISNAPRADFFVVFATRDSALRGAGIAAFIVPRAAPGLSVGPKERKLGQRACEVASVTLNDVFVPEADLLAAEGRGLALALRTFTLRRPDIAALATGLLQRSLDEATRYAQQRQTFGAPIARHQLVAEHLAELAMHTESARWLTRRAAFALDQGETSPLLPSIAKARATESAIAGASLALQVFGANGYSRAYPVEKLYRDARVLTIYEGTTEIQKLIIARALTGHGA